MQIKIFKDNNHHRLELDVNDWLKCQDDIYYDFEIVEKIEDIPNNTIIIWYAYSTTQSEYEEGEAELKRIKDEWKFEEEKLEMERIKQDSLDYREEEKANKARKIRELEVEIKALKDKVANTNKEI